MVNTHAGGLTNTLLDTLRRTHFDDEAQLAALRQQLYPSEGLNLNPGMLGTPALPVLDALRAGPAGMRFDFPLSVYGAGRDALEAARRVAVQCWPTFSAPAFPGGTTASMNLLTHALVPTFQQRGHTGRLRVLTSQHEHEGALGGFLHHPAYDVCFLPDDVLLDPPRLAFWIEREKPQLLLLSQVTYTEARRLPVEALFNVASAFPDVWRVLDAAQSVGWEPPAAELADLTVASAHKWLGGPHGTGLMWLSPRALEQLAPFSWLAGDEGRITRAAFEPAGGQTFMLWEALRRALELYHALESDAVARRGAALCALFLDALEDSLDAPLESRVKLLGADPRQPSDPVMPMLSLELLHTDAYPIYARLNDEGIFLKCIKTTLPLGRTLNVLRLGMLWYQSSTAARHAGQRLGALLRVHP